MNGPLIALSVLTGLLTGAIFRFLNVPIPAPPNLPGVLGIVGIYVGYQVIGYFGWGVDLMEALGI
jgi:XapX domain-containing protein